MFDLHPNNKAKLSLQHLNQTSGRLPASYKSWFTLTIDPIQRHSRGDFVGIQTPLLSEPEVGALGGAEEAHRRWPRGRSEQDASKAKVDPPIFTTRATAAKMILLCLHGSIFLIFSIAMQRCIWELMPHCDERPSETLPNLPGCQMKITLPVVMNTKKEPTAPNGANLRSVWDFSLDFCRGGFFWGHGPWIYGVL
jgi:hypothetical protein